MNLLPIDEVIIEPDRFRKTFLAEDIHKLMLSIREVGLIHLPVCQGKALRAGERRFRAIQQLYQNGETIKYLGQPIPAGMFPYMDYASLDPITAKEIELQENTRRANLSWQEEAQALAALHKFRQELDPTWSTSDTAKEASAQAHDVTVALNLVKQMSNPAVRQAKSKAEAVKIANKELERDLEAALRARQGKKESLHTLELCAAADGFRELPYRKFSVILTDPPYGEGAHKFHSHDLSGGVGHNYLDDWETAKNYYEVIAYYGFRATTDKAHAYVFCNIRRFLEIEEIFATNGWNVWPRPLIWSKGRGTPAMPDLGPSYDYETILFANKGLRPTMGLYSDVIAIPSVQHKRHAAEKPVDLYVDLLRRSVMPGDHVLDPFCGSGPIFEAAKRVGCIATGFDNDPACIDLSQERINGL